MCAPKYQRSDKNGKIYIRIIREEVKKEEISIKRNIVCVIFSRLSFPKKWYENYDNNNLKTLQLVKNFQCLCFVIHCTHTQRKKERECDLWKEIRNRKRKENNDDRTLLMLLLLFMHTHTDIASTTIIAFLPSNGFIASAMWKERAQAIWCIWDTQYARTHIHTKTSILPHPNTTQVASN